jgi:LysR family glycine cleavage system transcriptional activator
VKQLEEWLGYRLFQRLNNGLVLTEQGKALQPVLWDALERVAHGFQTIGDPTATTGLVISVQPNFALKWLIPRLDSFIADNRYIEPHVITAHRTLDLLNTDIDVAIRHLDTLGNQNVMLPELSYDFLCSAKMTPVASPAFLREQKIATPMDLAKATLLHVVGSPRDWSLWLETAGALKINPERGPRFDSYAASTEAAAHGWGVAMGLDLFTQDDIARGRLVAPFELRLPRTQAWYLITSKHFEKTKVTRFRNWILAQAGTLDRPEG